MFSGLVADSFPFAFSKALLKLNLWLSLAYRLRPAFCTCLLAVCQSSLLLQSGPRTGNKTRDGRVWVMHVGHWRHPGTNRDINTWGAPVACVGVFCGVCDVISRISVPLMHSQSLVAVLPATYTLHPSTPTTFMQLTAQYSGWGERNCLLRQHPI